MLTVSYLLYPKAFRDRYLTTGDEMRRKTSMIMPEISINVRIAKYASIMARGCILRKLVII